MRANARTPEWVVTHLIEKRPDGQCWTWRGLVLVNGYTQVQIGRRKHSGHRYVYEFFNGPIPETLQIDHICHDPATCAGGPTCPHRACVNPAHLKPVTARENALRSNSPAAQAARSTHCSKGHEYSHVNNKGWRKCRTCDADRMRARYVPRKRGGAS